MWQNFTSSKPRKLTMTQLLTVIDPFIALVDLEGYYFVLILDKIPHAYMFSKYAASSHPTQL